MVVMYVRLVEAGLRALYPNDDGIVLVPLMYREAVRAIIEQIAE